MFKHVLFTLLCALFISPTFAENYSVAVSLEQQRLFIYDDNQLIKTMTCSTAKAPKVTPPGEFEITGKKEKSSLDEGKINYYYLSFFNGYIAFHSTLYDENNKLITPDEEILGSPNTGGCVRLALANAKWIYDNLPEGTSVIIE